MKKVTYICDGKKWCAGEEGCHLNGGGCKHTKDIRHAKNFREWGNAYAESTACANTGSMERKVHFMIAEKKNCEVCEKIIEILHEKEISVEQSYAILEFVKRKIAQDTKVGELVRLNYEEL